MLKEKKPTVFVIMPFKERFYEIFDFLKENFKEEYEFNRAGDMRNHGNILKDIIESLDKADVVLADLTEMNPNVFYELGVAHTIEKKVIMITQSLGDVPFDMRQYSIIPYTMLLDELFETLRPLLKGAVDEEIIFGNPVTDFIKNTDNNKTVKENLIDNKTVKENLIDNKTVKENLINFIIRSFIKKFNLTTISEEDECTIRDWLEEWGPDMVDRATSIAASSMSEIITTPINYTKGILAKWKKNGIVNLEDIRPVY